MPVGNHNGLVMAGLEPLAQIRGGAAAWNAWRAANPQLLPELREANLGGVNLAGANLTRAALAGANLGRANLSGSLLRGADLSGADLNGANLRGADLAGARLADANLSRANLAEATLQRADFAGATLSLANLTKANGDHARFGKAVLSGAQLREASFRHADFTAADLTSADLARTYLGEAELSGANLRGADLRRANLHGAILSGANLSAADLGGSNLAAAVLCGADLTGANLRAANLSLADLNNTELTNVGWQTTAMRGCYRGVRGLESSFGNALFKRAAADQDFLDTLETHLQGSHRMALFWAWGLIDYGRSLVRVAALAFALAFFYGLVYRMFPQILDYHESARSWFTPYYFSIVTYTTLGFGDVRPATAAGEIIVSSEVILGYTTLGLLLSVLAQNIARRS